MPRPFWFIFIGHLINTTGGSFLWPLNTIYLHDYLGKSLSLAGFVLMLNAAASVIGNLLGGYLFDKIGGFKAIITGAGITLAALIALTFSHGWPSYAILLVFIGLGSGVVNLGCLSSLLFYFFCTLFQCLQRFFMIKVWTKNFRQKLCKAVFTESLPHFGQRFFCG